MRRPSRSVAAQQYRHLYGTQRWKQTRKAQLTAKPLCEDCETRGVITPATVCNHIDKDAKATEEGFFAGPFNSLCAPCHDAGQQKAENAGYSQSVGADGWPTDPRHPANTGRIPERAR